MMTILIPFLIALTGGVAAALQGPFAGIIGRTIGDLESVFITYCGGAAVVLLIMLLIKGNLQVAGWSDLPWYVLLSGPLGLVIVGSYSFAVPRLGAATATIVFVASSLTLGALFDHFGVFGVTQRSIDPSRLLGIGVFLIGIWLVR